MTYRIAISCILVGAACAGNIRDCSARGGHTQEFLERFELSELKYIGSAVEADECLASIADPSGMVHKVKLGNFAGKHYGEITSITEVELRLTEWYADESGWWKEASALLPRQGVSADYRCEDIAILVDGFLKRVTPKNDKPT
jgi:hypothetical protein